MAIRNAWQPELSCIKLCFHCTDQTRFRQCVPMTKTPPIFPLLNKGTVSCRRTHYSFCTGRRSASLLSQFVNFLCFLTLYKTVSFRQDVLHTKNHPFLLQLAQKDGSTHASHTFDNLFFLIPCCILPFASLFHPFQLPLYFHFHPSHTFIFPILPRFLDIYGTHSNLSRSFYEKCKKNNLFLLAPHIGRSVALMV